MCGIGGILSRDLEESVAPERLRRMQEAIAHRGPDDSGIWCRRGIGLAHRRLSIIDVDGGGQPMANASRNVWIVFNGEIYNHQELRRGLERAGYQYRTRSDTETILHLYEEVGPRCVELLRGMFAFALWDARTRRIMLARDRLGIKPLYYAISSRELVFGSEVKAILASDGVRAELEPAVLPEYLAYGYHSGPETFFKNVYKLLPGHLLVGSGDEGFTVRRYWSPPREPAPDDGSPIRVRAQEVRAALDGAVKSHLMSDVPVGVFLSGGLDSSGIAALAARHVDEPLQTFSVGFDEVVDERPVAQRIAAALGARHRDVVVTARAFFDALPRLIWHEDEPIAFSASVPLYFVSRLASRHVKVVLTGEGADELFLGYNRYRVTRLNQWLARGLGRFPRLQRIAPFMGSVLPSGLRRVVRRSALSLPPGLRSLYCENFAVFPEELRKALLPAELHQRDPHDVTLGYAAQGSGDLLQRLSHADLQTYLVELLMKQDQMSMAASIESRVPFLDHPLVEEVLGMPSRFKLDGWRTKAVLRDALAGVVPPEAIRRRKMGFSMPTSRWLRRDNARQVRDWLTSPRALERRLFDRTSVQRLVDEHAAGHADHGARLWLLSNLELWSRVFIDGETPPPISDSAAA